MTENIQQPLATPHLPANPEIEPNLSDEHTKQNFFHGQQRLQETQKTEIGFDGISNIDLDTDLWFKLRGNSLNPLIDAATPLFGMILRIQNLDQYTEIDKLYSRVQGDIAAISEEIRKDKKQYDEPTQLSYRYCLCAFIDETVMATTWGSQSIWAQRSLLSSYHEETWGGEKVFVILERMLMEAERYPDMLEFLYLCLALGFKGKYGVVEQGNEKLEAIIQKLHRVLREQKGDPTEHLIEPTENISQKKYKIKRQLPLWSVWATLGVILVSAYSYYAIRLHGVTEQVVTELEQILK
jgi:type VI secretion system protein ImpK